MLPFQFSHSIVIYILLTNKQSHLCSRCVWFLRGTIVGILTWATRAFNVGMKAILVLEKKTDQ